MTRVGGAAVRYTGGGAHTVRGTQPADDGSFYLVPSAKNLTYRK